MLIEGFDEKDIPHALLRDLYHYWLEKKGDRNMPLRSDINPVDIPRILPNISLVNVEHDTHRYKIRLVGTETVKIMGGDVTGKYLDEMPDIEKFLKNRYEWIVKEKRPYLYSDRLNWAGKNYLYFHSLGLPLTLDGKNVDILMYCTHYEMTPKDDIPSDLEKINLPFSAG